ncbi:MAG: zinc-ribbon domain-containing protein [Nitrosopumilus sp.]|nr:zinc-ribbon domain-containing protein [Nitrosopumilus sp.]MDA7941403.1 zinc-ribbon domain-containing protein [Nitrosopumilus sp.]MDA7942811.1 zinc-ribbon domain-containing protein [Nitrosopumilus sp.]MDA7945097.1 zinc-ribbon domain-containing protein [Nitrosopumilus sp.]MDA7952674.1 zinc-ribbon domain-containing protein [Nitrosopumilus sp.]
MKIRCPKCGAGAELTPGFAEVRCDSCGTSMSYGEYVRLVAHEDPAYSDILGDYAGGGRRPEQSDDWD